MEVSPARIAVFALEMMPTALPGLPQPELVIYTQQDKEEQNDEEDDGKTLKYPKDKTKVPTGDIYVFKSTTTPHVFELTRENVKGKQILSHAQVSRYIATLRTEIEIVSLTNRLNAENREYDAILYRCRAEEKTGNYGGLPCWTSRVVAPFADELRAMPPASSFPGGILFQEASQRWERPPPMVGARRVPPAPTPRPSLWQEWISPPGSRNADRDRKNSGNEIKQRTLNINRQRREEEQREQMYQEGGGGQAWEQPSTSQLLLSLRESLKSLQNVGRGF